MLYNLLSLGGILFFLGVAALFSNNRRKIPWKLVGAGVLLQFTFAVLMLKTVVGRAAFEIINRAAISIIEFTGAGTGFVFGPLVDVPNIGYVFAFHVLPVVIFFASLMSLLYHWGVMQVIVGLFARLMVKAMKVSGAEALAASANVFFGMTEAPLVIRPYIEEMTESELFCLMVGGMATVAGSVMVAYVGMGVDAGHLFAASVMSAPGAIVIAKIMRPETETPKTIGTVVVADSEEQKTENSIDAISRGATLGLQLALNIGAMLIVFLAFVALINGILVMVGTDMQTVLAYLFYPFAFAMGIPADELFAAAVLLGEKTVLNEFVAYAHLTNPAPGAVQFSERAMIILTYALCGFANFGSVGILIGGIGGICPERKGDVARLGLLSLVAGTLACFMTAAMAGMLLT
jgi:concentrative nucleoside transporter, CNT family